MYYVSIITLERLYTVVLDISPGKLILNAILSEQQEKASSNGERLSRTVTGFATIRTAVLNKFAAPVMKEPT